MPCSAYRSRFTSTAGESVRFRKPSKLVGMIDAHAAFLTAFDSLFQQIHHLFKASQAGETWPRHDWMFVDQAKNSPCQHSARLTRSVASASGKPAGKGKCKALTQMGQGATEREAQFVARLRISPAAASASAIRPMRASAQISSPVEDDGGARRPYAGSEVPRSSLAISSRKVMTTIRIRPSNNRPAPQNTVQ